MQHIPQRQVHRHRQGWRGFCGRDEEAQARWCHIGEINIAYFEKVGEVRINADKGRVRTPYIIVENGLSRFTPELLEKLKRKEVDFNFLVRRGVIEYLDAEEEENTNIAVDEKNINKHTTHLVVDASGIMGLTGNTSVFSEFNSVEGSRCRPTSSSRARGSTRRTSTTGTMRAHSALLSADTDGKQHNLQVNKPGQAPVGPELRGRAVHILRIQHEGRSHT